MSMVANNDSAGPRPSPGTGDPAVPAAGADSEEVVRLGDEHLKGVESLCVGESQ
jgi:hypothetical protein